MPIVALVISSFLSCICVSYKRPAHREKKKQHAEIEISWKGGEDMIKFATLLLAGVGVYRALHTDKVDDKTVSKVLIIGKTP